MRGHIRLEGQLESSSSWKNGHWGWNRHGGWKCLVSGSQFNLKQLEKTDTGVGTDTGFGNVFFPVRGHVRLGRPVGVRAVGGQALGVGTDVEGGNVLYLGEQF